MSVFDVLLIEEVKNEPNLPFENNSSIAPLHHIFFLGQWKNGGGKADGLSFKMFSVLMKADGLSFKMFSVLMNLP